MQRPVLVTAPDMLPVSLAEAKLHLRVDRTDDDTLIEGLIRAATEHLDGWTGILGRCLVEQEWRQDFDRFARCLTLPLGPVISITSVTVGGDEVDSGSYALRTDGGGRARVEFDGVPATGATAIVYKAGYPTIPEVPADGETPAVPARSTVPEPIKVAILFAVQSMYSLQQAGNILVRSEDVEGVGRTDFAVSDQAGVVIDRAVSQLIAPYRRVGL